MLRFILLSILLTLLFRAVSRLWAGMVRGMQPGSGSSFGRRETRVPQRGVQMARDPVCGTFVVPERAIALSTSRGERLYFCSAECREKYRARPAADQRPATGRTA
jgi:YHS domain-containing protein